MSEWFEVLAGFKVEAADEDDAINRIAGAIRRGTKKGDGIYPVGTFEARLTSSPLRSERPVGQVRDEPA